MRRDILVLLVSVLLFALTGTGVAQVPELIGTIEGSQDENLGDACRR